MVLLNQLSLQAAHRFCYAFYASPCHRLQVLSCPFAFHAFSSLPYSLDMNFELPPPGSEALYHSPSMTWTGSSCSQLLPSVFMIYFIFWLPRIKSTVQHQAVPRVDDLPVRQLRRLDEKIYIRILPCLRPTAWAT